MYGREDLGEQPKRLGYIQWRFDWRFIGRRTRGGINMTIGLAGDDFTYQSMVLLRILAIMQQQGLGVTDDLNNMLSDPAITQTDQINPKL